MNQEGSRVEQHIDPLLFFALKSTPLGLRGESSGCGSLKFRLSANLTSRFEFQLLGQAFFSRRKALVVDSIQDLMRLNSGGQTLRLRMNLGKQE